MNDRPLDEDDFARLFARPPGDPERERAERSPRFQAWKRMLIEFETPGESGLTAADRARDEPEIAARFERALHEQSAVGGTPARGRARARSDEGPFARLAAWWAGPAARPAFAAALVIVVAGGAWWATHREPAPVAMRGTRTTAGSTIALEPPHRRGDAVELRWAAIPDADAYRVVFYGSDLGERARVDGLTVVELSLRAGALPAGLASGEDVLVEVVGLRAGDAFAWSEMRSLRLP